MVMVSSTGFSAGLGGALAGSGLPSTGFSTGFSAGFSTGFSTGGATREDVALFAAHVAPHVKIKAAGGIASLQDAEDFIRLGASRLGTSRLVKIAKEQEK